jgi:hypothetical protein
MPLEVEVRNFYAFAHIDGTGAKTVYRLTSAPTGSRWIPLLAQILSVAIANAAIKIAAPNCAQYLRFQRQLLIDVCIDDIRVAVLAFSDASLKGWGVVLFEGTKISSAAEAQSEVISNSISPITAQGTFHSQEIIAVLEGRAAQYGINLIVRRMNGDGVRRDITFLVDNEALRGALRAGRSKNFHPNEIARDIQDTCNINNLHVVWMRVPTAENLADVLSRIDFGQPRVRDQLRQPINA